MNSVTRESRPARVAIGAIEIRAASALEARRLADALPAALDRAFARPGAGAQAAPRRQRPADRVAAEIARAVEQRLEGRR